MRGVVLIAAGHPLYTHYAFNLALSIRDHSSIPIALFYQGAGLSQLLPYQHHVFSQIEEIPKEYYTENGKEVFIKVKTHLYDLTPFDETVFLDADMVFSPFKKIEDLFDENKDREIQFACRGDKNMQDNIHSEWVSLPEIKEKFGFEHWYELSSEVIYFKKGETAKKVFDLAKHYYSNHGMNIKRWVVVAGKYELEKKPNAITEFAGGVPDEVPFSIALEVAGVKIKSPYVPSYWQPQHFKKITSDVEVKKNYYLISIGGKKLQTNTERIYNSLMSHYHRMAGIKRSPYPAQIKEKLLHERKKI